MTLLPADRSTNLSIWVVIWCLLLAWQLFTSRRSDAPSIVAVVRLLRRHPVTRLLLLTWWAWLGWHLFVRTTF